MVLDHDSAWPLVPDHDSGRPLVPDHDSGWSLVLDHNRCYFSTGCAWYQIQTIAVLVRRYQIAELLQERWISRGQIFIYEKLNH
jgi:hypothetical protein